MPSQNACASPHFPRAIAGHQTPSAAVLLLGALVLTACGARPTPVYEFQFFALGTLVEVTLANVDERPAQEARRAIEGLFRRAEQDWDPWRPGALWRFNRRLAGGRPFAVDRGLLPLLQGSSELSRRSHGLFDPAIGRLTELWGFHRDEPRGRPPEPEALAALMRRPPAMSDLGWNGREVQGTNPAVQIDLGAYAKGYAVDQAIAHLRDLGIANALVNAGGDLRAIGRRGERPWHIGIRRPRAAGVLAILELGEDESVLTSGDYERFFIYDGKRYHHILDPRTGYPAEGAMAATVICRGAAQGDAAATALVVAGPTNWRAVARDMGIAEAMLIDSLGRIHPTEALRPRLRFTIDPERVPMAPKP
jgi:thiamine biosynthesis lipoprotein